MDDILYVARYSVDINENGSKINRSESGKWVKYEDMIDMLAKVHKVFTEDKEETENLHNKHMDTLGNNLASMHELIYPEKALADRALMSDSSIVENWAHCVFPNLPKEIKVKIIKNFAAANMVAWTGEVCEEELSDIQPSSTPPDSQDTTEEVQENSLPSSIVVDTTTAAQCSPECCVPTEQDLIGSSESYLAHEGRKIEAIDIRFDLGESGGDTTVANHVRKEEDGSMSVFQEIVQPIVQAESTSSAPPISSVDLTTTDEDLEVVDLIDPPTEQSATVTSQLSGDLPITQNQKEK